MNAWEGPVLARMLLEGHAIGNRLWQETGNTVADQSAATLLAAQYFKAEKKIRALIQSTNQDAASLYAKQSKLYRRPGGDTRVGEFLDPENYIALTREPYLKPYADVIDWLKEVYDYSGWHVSAADKTIISSYGMTRRVVNGSKDGQGAAAFLCAEKTNKRALEAAQGLVIQLRDGDKLTTDALPQIILQLRARGAEFKLLPRAGDKANTFLIGVEEPPTPDPEGVACTE